MNSLPCDRYDLERNVHRITSYSLPNCNHTRSSLPDSAIILHLDIDAFYAQVEQHDFDLRGIPVIIGSWHEPDGSARGIVATASYEARRLEIRTGMSYYEALKCCPYVVPFRIDYEKYRAVSKTIGKILEGFSPSVERYSMDEYFADLTHFSAEPRDRLEQLVSDIKKKVWQQSGLISSVGIAHNKSYAKLASGLQKPNGVVYALNESEIHRHLHHLPLREVWGIGSGRSRRLASLGLNTIADAFRLGSGSFEFLFGPHLGRSMWLAATGKERTSVITQENPPEQFHHLHTFPEATSDCAQIKAELAVAIETVAYRMRGYGMRCAEWEVYLRFKDTTWEGVPIPIRLRSPTYCDETIIRECWKRISPILSRFIGMGQLFLGVGITALHPDSTHQLEWAWGGKPDPETFYKGIDRVNNIHGLQTVQLARCKLAHGDRVHFLPSRS